MLLIAKQLRMWLPYLLLLRLQVLLPKLLVLLQALPQLLQPLRITQLVWQASSPSSTPAPLIVWKIKSPSKQRVMQISKLVLPQLLLQRLAANRHCLQARQVQQQVTRQRLIVLGMLLPVLLQVLTLPLLIRIMKMKLMELILQLRYLPVPLLIMLWLLLLLP